ncbi:type II toxin-antitoxin system ParD family antitoxin [Flavobacterium sp. TAB 87]|nr:type II toxin-antitoxin system ParD family antitoxin [Flavobacterium sp. TAB 87]
MSRGKYSYLSEVARTTLAFFEQKETKAQMLINELNERVLK